MLCRVALFVLICEVVQALKCGQCNCYTDDGEYGNSLWTRLKTTTCNTTNTFTSVPDTSVLPADTQVLHLQNQNIPTIKQNQFITFEKVQVIIVQNCKITTVESHAFRNMINVTVISLHVNLISTLPTDLFTDTPNLESIYLGHNKLKILQENLFMNLKQLEGVYLQFNEIISINENIFVNLPRLRTLALDTNKLKSLNWSIINKLSSLNILFIYSNPWHCDIKLCEGMSAYVYSHLWGAVVKKPTCASPVEVAGKDWRQAIDTVCNEAREKYCGTCRCTNDPSTVTCAAPYRPWIPHEMHKGVVKLNITGQSMSTVNGSDFLYFKDLQRLYLENNNIRVIKSNAFDPVKNIAIISLAHNKLTDVQKHIFSNLTNLKEIDLSHNELNHIEDDCFANQSSLESVDLSNNRLQTLKLNIFFDVSKLSLLALHDNPWKCDEALCEVMNAVVRSELWASDREPMCASPRSLHKKPWTAVHLQFQPRINSTRVSSVTEGDNVTLHCSYCFVSRVLWTFNGKKLPKLHQTISNGTATLTLKSVGTDEEGYYECQVKNCDYCDYDEVLLKVSPREAVTVEQVFHSSMKVNNSTNAKRGLLLLYYTFLPATKFGNFTQSQNETIVQNIILKKIMNVK